MALPGGFGWDLGSLPLLRDGQSFSLSAENPTGARGQGGRATEGFSAVPSRELGQGWKVSPCIAIGPREVVTLANVEGPALLQHIWFTTDVLNWRKLVLRIYWDEEASPSVEVPLGDFFAQCWNCHRSVASLPVAVNPRGGLNCFWPMPFRRRCRMTVENITPDPLGMFFYQISGVRTELPPNIGTFHARFRRENPVPLRQPFTIVDDIRGRGHYVGTFLGWGANTGGWWGEGEIKFYVDDDEEFPSICGTGTEDYVGGAWGFEDPPGGEYVGYSTPFMGFTQASPADSPHHHTRRFNLYRWHVMDPIYFHSRLRVTIQALGLDYRREGQDRYRARQDDVCAVAYWYQTEPHHPVANNELTDPLLVIH